MNAIWKVFDTHVHPRIGPMLEAVVPILAHYCQAVVVMPNTADIRTGAQAASHRQEIRDVAAMAGYPDFNPLMTVLLTDDTDPDDVATWPDAGVVAGKYYPGELYPHGGVNDLGNIRDVINEMRMAGIIFSGHFEKAGVYPSVAERVAISDFRRVAEWDIRTIFEHASTLDALKAVNEYLHTAATITPQHLRMTLVSSAGQVTGRP